MKGLLKLALLHLLTALLVYFLIFLLGNAWPVFKWLIIIAAIVLVVSVRRRMPSLWWIELIKMKLWGFVSKIGGKSV